jgi:hypothetical protein
MFAPWLRHIFVVLADGQESRFQLDHQLQLDVTLVPHSILYSANGCKQHLPVFNSHSIEAHLHQVPGLAEHFLYANDDTFFGAPIHPSLFFELDTGKPKVCTTRTILARRNAHQSSKSTFPQSTVESWLWARWNNSAILDQLRSQSWMARHNTQHRWLRSPTLQFQQPDRYEWVHQIRPMRRSFYEEAWMHPLLLKSFQQTSAAKFRSQTDVEPVGLLLHWKTDMGCTCRCKVRTRTFVLNDYTVIPAMFENILQGKYDLYCINDTMQQPSPQMLVDYEYGLRVLLPHHFADVLYGTQIEAIASFGRRLDIVDNE